MVPTGTLINSPLDDPSQPRELVSPLPPYMAAAEAVRIANAPPPPPPPDPTGLDIHEVTRRHAFEAAFGEEAGRDAMDAVNAPSKPLRTGFEQVRASR